MTFDPSQFNPARPQPFGGGGAAAGMGHGSRVGFGVAQTPGLKEGRLYYGAKALNRHGYSKPNKAFLKGGAIIGLSNWITRNLDRTVAQKESVMGQSHTRFAQDTATVLGGKLTAVRSAAEALEAFFLEFVESALFYYSVPFIGTRIRHGWLKAIDENAQTELKEEWLKAARSSQVKRDIDKIRAELNNPKWEPDSSRLKELQESAKKTVQEGIDAKHYDKLADAIQTSAEELGLKSKVKESFENVSKGKRALMALKGATIFSVLSAVVMEYALNFVKNLMTLKVFNQGDFTDVVNLTDGSHKSKEKGEHPTETTAKRWIKNCVGIAAAILAGSYGLVKGRDKEWVYNINKKMVKAFDFSYAHKMEWLKDKKKWMPKLTMGLGNWQMRMIIMLGGLGYLHASRDKLELKENFFRVQCVVVPYLAFGQQILENLYARGARAGLFGSKVKSSFNRLNKGPKQVFEGNAISRAVQWLLKDDYKQKSHDEIVEEAFKKAGINEKYRFKHYMGLLTGTLEKNKPEFAAQMKADLKKAMPHYKPLAVAKNTAFIAPFLFGVAVVGSGVAWMNRFWTEERFSKIQQDKATALFSHVNIDRHGVYHQAKRVSLNPEAQSHRAVRA